MGVVTRTRSASSTREVIVKLTVKGNAQVARLIPIARDYEAAAIAGLRADELDDTQTLPAARLCQYEKPCRLDECTSAAR